MSANPLLSIEGLTASVDEKTILHNVMDLHYPVRSRHPFAGKYPAAGIHTSVSRLVYSGIGFQPYL